MAKVITMLLVVLIYASFGSAAVNGVKDSVSKRCAAIDKAVDGGK